MGDDVGPRLTHNPKKDDDSKGMCLGEETFFTLLVFGPLNFEPNFLPSFSSDHASSCHGAFSRLPCPVAHARPLVLL